MTGLTTTQAQHKALEIIQASLTGGAIKLSGTSGGATPEDAGTKDAAYLSVLITKLTDTIREASAK